METWATIGTVLSWFVDRFAVVVASLVALYGIRSWQVELRGRKRFEIAEATLVAFFKARDALEAIRSPLGYESEGKSREAVVGETENQKRARDQAYVVFERVKARNEVFDELISIQYRFMAYFGEEMAKPFDELFKVRSKLIIAARMLAEMWARPTDYFDSEEGNKAARENIEKQENVIWSQGEEDEVRRRVNSAVEEMEATCRRFIGDGSPPPTNFWRSLLSGEWWR